MAGVVMTFLRKMVRQPTVNTLSRILLVAWPTGIVVGFVMTL